MSPQQNSELTVNEYMAAFAEQMRANRRSNDFLEFCDDLYVSREATQLAWLVDAAVRTYEPEMLGENFTEAEIWPRLRTKVLEDLHRVDFQAWSVRHSCPIDHLEDDAFEQADHVIISQPLRRDELPRFEAYELPVGNPWAFVGIVPEIGHTLPKPRWWNRPRMYWKATRGRHDGRPVFEPAVSVRPSYDPSLIEVRTDLRRLGLPLEAQKINPRGGTEFEIVWNRDEEAYRIAEILRGGGAE